MEGWVKYEARYICKGRDYVDWSGFRICPIRDPVWFNMSIKRRVLGWELGVKIEKIYVSKAFLNN